MEADAAQEEAKYESQSTTIITKEDIAKKQAKSVEDIIFSEVGVTRTVDAMGRVGVSIRGAEPRHTLILVDGQPVMGDFAKYYGAADELQRLGTENVERIEIIRGAASAKYGADAIGGVINVVTKQPAKTAGLHFNVEGRRERGDSDVFPYANAFLRADTGQMGKFRFSLYGIKRDLMPIYATEGLRHSISADIFDWGGMQGVKNSLRFYGNTANVGIMASYDIDARNSLQLSANRYTEELERYSKHTDSPMEPIQHFKRSADRNNYSFSWRGSSGGNTDWNVELNYARMNEDDVTLTSEYAKSMYEGKNKLDYVDDIDHRQYGIKASANTQAGKSHLLTYGFGYTREQGSGSRLKNAPHTYTRTIDPWDYDKSLHIDSKTGAPDSGVHNYQWKKNANGQLEWDYMYEKYGYDENNAATHLPKFTYEDYLQVRDAASGAIDLTTLMSRPDLLDKFMEFGDQLQQEAKNNDNPDIANPFEVIAAYYRDKNVYLNGKTYEEEYAARTNQQIVGEATIHKEHIFLQDTWQLNQNTILAPIVRLDHSSLFGSHVTANLGMTHNLNGNAHRRLKVNLGTGYTEPGMGELYYNWEMYGSNPMGFDYKKDQHGNALDKDGNIISPSDPDFAKKVVGGGKARMGWYWEGNPNLKPETSINFDLAVEGENKNTYAKAGIFYNRIRNYMTTYFTGSLMDFSPQINESTPQGQFKWMSAPDMIYSFKNIGRAEISGIEAEVEQKLGSRWTAKLGYAFLHAINKSDPNMPRRLLDKPQHKLDIGLTYTDEKNGWQATLWGDYYIHMLDSNSIADGGNYLYSRPDPNDSTKSIITHAFTDKKNITYEKKTFGLWNLMVQKRLGKDGLVYLGVDNLLNHRDDDRAFGGRVYRLGVNLKFDSLVQKSRARGTGGDGANAALFPLRDGTAHRPLADTATRQGDFFITKPFDETKRIGTEIIGDYRIRWNAHDGTNRPAATVSATADISDAARNMLDRSAHGFEQRLRVGVDARLGENTNLTVLGSAAGMSSVDTAHEPDGTRGLNHARLQNADVTQHAKKWDLSLGRLTEPLGVTGYYFAKEYDGARAVWTGGRGQVRVGYGTFRHATGVSDSAYTRATVETFYRAPTASEFLGYKTNEFNLFDITKEEIVPNADPNINFAQQLKAAHTRAEKYAIVRRLVKLMKDAYGEDAFKKDRYYLDSQYPILYGGGPEYQYVDSHGTLQSVQAEGAIRKVFRTFPTRDANGRYDLTYDDPAPLEGDGSKFALDFWDKNKTELMSRIEAEVRSRVQAEGGTFVGWTTTDVESKIRETIRKTNTDENWNSSGAQTVFNAIRYNLQELDQRSILPREALGRATGLCVPVKGTVLHRDTIPPIDKALFIQTKYEITPDLGIAAWYLKSVGDRTRTYAAAHGTGNDLASFDNLASVIGVGAKLRLGRNAAVSLDYGQNRTAFGRYMNGGTVYDHTRGNSDFKMLGRAAGGIPSFYVLRFDIGESDTDRPGSWNAFVAYKRFDHGSFFGGNGTESLPDRYLDGIRSFTIGGGYVPMPNLLVEAFYTFDAKGINKRDTLYGAENFKLGNYARVQVTYKF